MRTFSHFPSPELRPYVDRFWGWEAAEGETVSLPTVLPGTGAELFFHYRTPFSRIERGAAFALERSHLLCVRRAPVALARMEGVGFVAVRFRAGGLHRFVRTPGHELIDQQPRAQDLWGEPGRTLAAQVIDAASGHERVGLLQSFLLRQMENIVPDPLVSTAATQLYRHCSNLPIAQAASSLGIGRRQFERRFLQVTGLAPVEARRLARLQKTARMLLLDAGAACADAALAHGYYDQSHFIREFKSLAALPPLDFLAQARLKTHFYNTPRSSSEKIRFEHRAR